MPAPPPSNDPAGLLGCPLGRGYQATAFIGEGDLGFVYQGEHAPSRQTCALKLLRPEIQRDPRRLREVLQSGERLTRMHLDAILRPDEVLRSTDHTVLVLPLLVGASLSALLQRHVGPLPWVHARHLLIQVAEALSGLHATGLACGGLKPSNVFVIRDASGAPRVWLLDAMLSRHDPKAASVAYMAPECNAAVPDTRADMYSLGCLAYEILTAQPLFPGAPAQLALMHRVKPPRAIRSAYPETTVPSEVEGIVLRALEKDPSSRPDIDMFLNVLRASTVVRGAGSLAAIFSPDDPPTMSVSLNRGASDTTLSIPAGYRPTPEDGATNIFRREPLPPRASRSGEVLDRDHVKRVQSHQVAHTPEAGAPEHTLIVTPQPGRTTLPLAEHTLVVTPGPVQAKRPPLVSPAPGGANPPPPAPQPLEERTLVLGPGGVPAQPHADDARQEECTAILAMNRPGVEHAPEGNTSRTQILPGFGGPVLDRRRVPASSGAEMKTTGPASHRPSPWHSVVQLMVRIGPRPGWWGRLRRARPGALPARRGLGPLHQIVGHLTSLPRLISQGFNAAKRPLGRLYSLRGKLAAPFTGLRNNLRRVGRTISRWTGGGDA